MEFWSLSVFGVLIGMQHALEADHLAAVAALGARRSTRRRLILRGAYWGVGHSLSLFTICGAVVLLGFGLTARMEATLEFAVGIMVLLLGANVLREVSRRRIHFHAHDHGDGAVHVHAHSHAGEAATHAASAHRHAHPAGGHMKALLVGLVHGAAGSGALLVLAVAAARSAADALLYVLSFGAGSIVGMAALSFVASYPLKALERGAAWLHTATLAAIGAVAVLIGGGLMAESWAGLGY